MESSTWLPIQTQAEVAWDMLQGIPEKALDLLRRAPHISGDLVKTESDVHRPSFKDSVVWVNTLGS